MDDNVLLLTDSYKLSHFGQYPRGTEKVYSYFESRGGKFQQTLFFGLHYILEKYLAGPVVTQEKINQAETFYNHHMGGGSFNREGWQYILDQHAGYLPIKIKAVPEGSIVPVRNVLVTVENTDPKCFWLTNYVETLLVQLWYPITVATQSWYMKQILLRHLDETGNPGLIDFKLHDFGFRGVSSVETAGIGGAAHLVNFKGTDTIPGILLADQYYDSGVCGFSIPASEHSTITSWGKEHEVDAMRNMLNQYPSGLMACVSDSFDIFKACKEYWGGKLRQKVMERDGVLVVRPDSGDPIQILPMLAEILGEAFGYTTNDKGYKVLHPKVRMIQGDGVEFDTLEGMLNALRFKGWSADNIAFGSGGGLLQKLNRDTLKFAFKCSSVVVNGEEREVYKQPITDSVKVSKKGRLKLTKIGPTYTTTKDDGFGVDDVLETVFENGVLTEYANFDKIRELAHRESVDACLRENP